MEKEVSNLVIHFENEEETKRAEKILSALFYHFETTLDGCYIEIYEGKTLEEWQILVNFLEICINKK